MKTSDQWGRRRMDKAVSTLGSVIPKRVLAFAWHLQGAETQEIAQYVGIPTDTLNGVFKRLFDEGLPALEDRRYSASEFRPPVPAPTAPQAVEIGMDAELINIQIGSLQLSLDRNDSLLCRTVLLVFLKSGCVEATAVADALGVSEERLRKLRAKLHQNGASALVDQRRGQTLDYAMPAPVKAELIRHYVERTEREPGQ